MRRYSRYPPPLFDRERDAHRLFGVGGIVYVVISLAVVAAVAVVAFHFLAKVW